MKTLLPLTALIINLCLLFIPIQAALLFAKKEKVITCKSIETIGKLNIIAKTALNANEKLFVIDLSSPFTYQTQTLSTIVPHDTRYIEHNSQQYLSINDKLNLNSCSSSVGGSTTIDIPYYKSLFLPSSASDKTVLSFAYKPFNNDKQYSVIDMLYANQLIYHKQFLLTFTQDKGYHIIIGKQFYPPISDTYPYSAKCKVVSAKTAWSCKLNAVYIKGFNMRRESVITDIYNNTLLTSVAIQTNSSSINVPLYYFNYLNHTPFFF